MKTMLLNCINNHRFTAYFSPNQVNTDLTKGICCPICNDSNVSIVPILFAPKDEALAEQITLPNYEGQALIERVLNLVANSEYPKLTQDEERCLQWLMNQINALNFIPKSDAANLLNRLATDHELLHLQLVPTNILQ